MTFHHFHRVLYLLNSALHRSGKGLSACNFPNWRTSYKYSRHLS